MESKSNIVAKAVLEELQANERRPFDLLESLAKNKGYSSLEIKQALAQLLDDARIELTSQRILRTR